MALKTCSRPLGEQWRLAAGFALGLLVFACAPTTSVTVYDRQIPPAPPPVDKLSVPPTARPDTPQASAALALVKEGRQLLAQGAPDAAIRVLERSIALDSDLGQNYYYLAEAWLMKHNARRAREFNFLAARHLGRDAGWQGRIERQYDRIQELDR
jgi:hypothetical protein